MQDLRFPTFSVPMHERFYRDSWTPLMEELASEYPSRFGEVWLYVGPVLNPKGKHLASGISYPSNSMRLFLILQQKAGCGRLPSFCHMTRLRNLWNNRITSIEAIESLTGLSFSRH